MSDQALDWLETEISAVSCWHHGTPSYEHDANWMKDRVLHLIVEARRAFAPPPASTNGLTDDSVAQWQWRWKGDEEWRNSDAENCAIAAANPQGLFEVRALYVTAPPASTNRLTDEQILQIWHSIPDQGMPFAETLTFARAVINAHERRDDGNS